MKSSVKKLLNSQIELEVSITAEEFNGFIEKAILSLGKDLEVKGFRKGKVPKEIAEKKAGSRKILFEAANLAIKENYPRAVFENKIEAISEPEIEILKLAPGNPFVFRAKILTLPEIKLVDYKKIASQVKRRKISTEEKEVEETLKWLKKNYSKTQKEKFPEINDEWARSLGRFKNLAELKKNLREGLNLEKEVLEQKRVRQEIIEKIAKDSEVEIPEVLIEREKNQMLENLKRGVTQVLKISFEDYLRKLSKTEKELLESLSSEAERRIKNSLILKEVGKKENIEVSEKELQEELNKTLKRYLGGKKTEKELDLERLRVYTKEVIKTEKIFQFLENLSRGHGL